jgi:hypothetical protein
MAITTAVCNSYKSEIMDGIHLAADTYMLALFTSSAALDQTITAYGTGGAGTNEVVGTGYTAGGVALTGRTNALSGNTAYITFANPVWPTSTITAAGALVYNASRSNRAVAVFSFGGNFVSTAGTFTVQLPAPGITALVSLT